MGETGKNGEDSKLVKQTNESVVGEQSNAEKQETVPKVEQPSVGFNEQGYLVVKIHAEFGYLTILGFLEKAKDFMKMHVAMQEQEKAQRLVKPSKKGILQLFK